MYSSAFRVDSVGTLIRFQVLSRLQTGEEVEGSKVLPIV